MEQKPRRAFKCRFEEQKGPVRIFPKVGDLLDDPGVAAKAYATEEWDFLEDWVGVLVEDLEYHRKYRVRVRQEVVTETWAETPEEVTA